MLNLAELFRKKKGIVGIDIGSSSLKLVEIAEAAQGFVLNRAMYEPLSPGIIKDGNIIDEAAVINKLKDLVEKSGCKAIKAVSSASGHSVIITKSGFPPLADEELREPSKMRHQSTFLLKT